MRLTDDEIKTACEILLDTSIGQDGGTLSNDRARAMRYYNGDMTQELPAEEGRSEYTARDVQDTVESVLPSLMKLFMDEENAIEFTPVGPEDEEQAIQETQAIRHVLWEQNDGFLLLYTFFKDALLSKTGVIKTCFEEGEVSREEYHGLLPSELAKLMNDPAAVVEVLEPPEWNEDGSVDVVLAVQRTPGRAAAYNVPPEEFGVAGNARSPNVKDAKFAYHRTRKTVSELIEMGFDRKVVEELPFDQDPLNEERLARYEDVDEEAEWGSANVHRSMDEIWLTECYIRIDANDDGIAEILKVILAGETPGSVLLDKEEVDRSRLVTTTPVIMTHNVIGKSLADLVMDIQEIRTSLMRGILDNAHLSNNVRIAANELVNFDDLLISRAGGVIRTEGTTPPGQNLLPLQHPAVPQETFGLLEVLDNIVKGRTGVGDDVMGLDINALSNVNTGVMMQAYEAARMRIELIARILAEVGVKELYRDLHELMCKNVDRPLRMKLNQQWQDVNPSEWRDRTNVKINIGTGSHGKERRMMALSDVQQTQAGVMQSPFAKMIQPQNIYAAAVDRFRALNMDPGKYITPPDQIPREPPPPPPPEAINAQANMIKAQNDSQRLQIDMQKAQMDSQTKMMITQSKERESQIKMQMEQLKSQVSLRKQQVDEQSQILNAMTGQERQQAEESIAIRRQGWIEHMDTLELQLKQYQSELTSLTQYRTTLLQAEMNRDAELQRQQYEIQQLRNRLEQRTGKRMQSTNGGGGESTEGTGDS